MKKSQIIKCLKAHSSKISAYEVKIHHKDSRELFYVLDHLEINRAVKTETDVITVYISEGDTTGSSTISVTAADNEKSLNRKIKQAISQARAARNKFYPLQAKDENIKAEKPKILDLNQIACKAAEAVMAADTYKDGWINSTEIFVSRFDDEFINSNGVHHHSESFRIEIECIPTWSNNGEEFELYKFYESNKIDYKQITNEIAEILQSARDRAEARTLKEVELPDDLMVMIKGEMLEGIVFGLANELNYRSLYMKENHYDKGDRISDTGFDLTMKGQISGCARSREYDGHGTVLGRCKIIDDGVAKNNYGDIRFGFYLAEEKITGDLPLCEVKADGIEVKRRPHLIIDSFSSPQYESDSGYWGGEVRLARYYDGKKYIPLTGFSIAGTIYDDIRSVKFSREQVTTPAYKGPEYMIFTGLKIN